MAARLRDNLSRWRVSVRVLSSFGATKFSSN